MRGVARGLAVLFALAIAGGCAGDDDSAGEADRSGGFSEIAFHVESPGGRREEGCALLAATDAERERGLMFRTDLKPYEGMVFRFPTDTTSPFWMRNTPLPLSIAWFDDLGQFVSATDMTPCGDRDTCPLYHPAGTYRVALEVEQGDFEELGVTAGSRLMLGASPCPGS